jgi:hypothetical protein
VVGHVNSSDSFAIFTAIGRASSLLEPMAAQGHGGDAMHTVHYAAVAFLIACMIWAAAMTLKPDNVMPRVQDGAKRRSGVG